VERVFETKQRSLQSQVDLKREIFLTAVSAASGTANGLVWEGRV